MLWPKIGDKVVIVKHPTKKTPASWIGRIGTVIAVPDTSLFTPEEWIYMVSNVEVIQVETDTGNLYRCYLGELSNPATFMPTDYEYI
jgi:hypothetical protein